MKENKPTEKTMGIFIKVNPEEELIIKKLREKHCVNISQFLRKNLIDYYNKLENLK